MIAYRSLFRINLLAWKSSFTCVKSGPLPYFQKFNFGHALSSELKMDVRKGKKSRFDRKKRIEVAQTWRAVSKPNCRQDASEMEEVQDPVENIQDAVSITISTVNSNHDSINELVGSDKCLTTDGKSLDDSSRSPEKHSMPMEVGASLMRFIKGKGGATQEEIEAETRVQIIFPSSKKEDSIIIEGDSATSVANASKKIQIIIDKAVNSREFDYSHFVSLPLAIHPELVDKLVSFQNKILGVTNPDKDEAMESDASADATDEVDEIKIAEVSVELEAENADPHVKVNITSDQHSTEAPLIAVAVKAEDSDTPVKVNTTNIPLVSYPSKASKSASKASSSKLTDLGIEKSIFIKPKTFHLTVLMLKLWNKDRVQAAAEVLQSVSSKVLEALENRPVQVKLKGLDCMRGSPAKARVLHAPVEEVGGEVRLLRACQVITDAFTEAGLVIDKDVNQKLKLHATLMNARHRKRKNRSRKVDSFDALGIFDLYGSEEWGEYLIREAHLSQRFLFDENGYYHCCTSIPFPDSMQVD